MSEKQTAGPPSGLNFAEVLYIVFRHKWKILLVSLLGIGGAVALPFLRPFPYQSDAKLYIRYVVESRTPTQVGDNADRIRSPDSRGDSILNTEMEILTSMDLALQVADAIGPERILAKVGRGSDRLKAAAAIQRKLTAVVPRDSSVISLSFQHPDPQVTQSVLKSLIDFYFKKHAQIHAVGAFDEFLTRETDQRRSQLVETEGELRKAKAKLGIFSLDKSKLAYANEMARLQEQLYDRQAELAEHQAVLREMTGLLPNTSVTASNQTSPTISLPAVPREKLDEYRRTCTLLDSLSRREQELLVIFTPSNSFVQDVRRQITAVEERKNQMESANPGLLAPELTATNGIVPGRTDDPRVALATETARVRGLESRVQTLSDQLEQVKKKAAELTDAEGPISELQRRMQLQETNYVRFSQSLEQSQIDDKLGAGKVSNISVIQEPTAPAPEMKKLLKMMGIVLFGGIASAFGLAFLIELFLDTSVKRRVDVETKLRLPFLMSLPRIRHNGKPLSLSLANQARLLTQTTSESDPPSSAADNRLATTRQSDPVAAVASWDPRHILRPYYDALRDRLITYFEVNNMTHKPKLVAVTSCAEGSGVSSVAAGLAASLSETGDGNVLLVDMNLREGAAHAFHKGELACGLEDALAMDRRSSALVQHNLYVVTEQGNSDLLPSVLPTRFKNLVPRLKASDYDYIIFDMPAVNQVSITPRLARLMDMVLMVVEAEKTDVAVIKRASSLLTQSKQNLAIVLNKSREYLSKALNQEF